jgi:hypothetical protein
VAAGELRGLAVEVAVEVEVAAAGRRAAAEVGSEAEPRAARAAASGRTSHIPLSGPWVRDADAASISVGADASDPRTSRGGVRGSTRRCGRLWR